MVANLMDQDIRYLTGAETTGRLSGTAGARMASSYLADALAALNLIAAGDDGYFQWLNVPAARITGAVRLTVSGTAYRYRKDFGETTRLSSGGSLRAPLVVVTEESQLRPEDLTGKVALIPQRPEGFDLNATVRAAVDLGVAGLLVEWGEPKWFHKTLFGSADNRIPVVRVRHSVAAALASRQGAQVELDLPLTVEALPCRNVLGLLRGIDPTRTVALTAHYDHLGDDPNGERFPGAIDNASGVVTMLAVARALVERKKALPFNVLVGFLTGEESGMWGAKHLAARSAPPLSAVINLDGMGYEQSLRAIRLGYAKPGHWLADMAAEVFQQRGIEVRWTPGSDDSAAFQAAGLPALGLGQMATESMPAGLHSPDDTGEVLALPTIQEGADAILALLDHLAKHPAMA